MYYKTIILIYKSFYSLLYVECDFNINLKFPTNVSEKIVFGYGYVGHTVCLCFQGFYGKLIIILFGTKMDNVQDMDLLQSSGDKSDVYGMSSHGQLMDAGDGTKRRR